jgi:hypothetical protein
MTILRTNTISGVGTNGPVFDGSLEFNSQNYVILPKGTTGNRVGVGSTTGALRYNTDSNKVELYDGNQWVEVQSSRPDLNGGARGVFGGGATAPGTRINTIEYININSTGNSIDFGDLVEVKSDLAACSSSIRGIFSGAFQLSPVATRLNTIEYITISSTGNSADFGDLTVAKSNLDSCSNSTRGLVAAGYVTPTGGTNVIEYFTISSTGNSVSFGNLSGNRYNVGSFASPTRGIFGGGYTGVAPTSTIGNVIDFVTISTLGNAQDFGDLSQSRANHTGCSNPIRGIFIAGITPTVVTTIDYITISTLGNAVKFGDTSIAHRDSDACASSTRGVFAGGYSPTPAAVRFNTIEYVTILTQGNSVDFGDLTATRSGLSACSNAHGGL